MIQSKFLNDKNEDLENFVTIAMTHYEGLDLSYKQIK